MTLRVGLTGGIASGKSTIMRILRELGCTTVDADHIVADLYRSGRAGHEALVATYGREILRDDGEVDRKKLADIAFASPESAKRLNALIHPLVLAEETRMAEQAEGIVVVEATLLLEAGGKQRYDRIVVADVPPEVQLARGVARGMAPAEVLRRMANQMPREERLAQADYVIDNSGDEKQLEGEVRRVHALLAGELSGRG